MEKQNRRQLKTRQANWVQRLTERLVRTDITPNQISLVSVGFAAIAGLCFYLFADYQSVLLLLLAAGSIQLRLLCNLMDGLVAVEGGKGTRSGELFNDVPDRVADVLILLGAGYAVSVVDWAVTLGWIAGVLAVCTAYIRTLGSSLGAPTSFMGPMAKQHRMGLLTAGTLITMLEVIGFSSHYVLLLTLIVLVIGTLWTCYRRLATIYHYLESAA